MTRYGVAYFGSPISVYGLDDVRLDTEVLQGKKRKTRKNRMGKSDVPSPQ